MDLPKNVQDLVQWGFYSLLSFVIIYVAHTLAELRQSLQSLAISMAQLAEKHNAYEDRLDQHERRLEKLEDLRKN